MADATTITFEVPGIPRPSGSKKGFYVPGKGGKKGHVAYAKAGGEKEENWRQAVSFAAQRAMGERTPLTGPVRMDVTFILPRPKKHYHTSKARAGQLRDDAPTYHTSAPDRTKLLRGTEDAMKGIVYRDDGQVVDGPITKVYGERPGASIKITPLDGCQAAQRRADILNNRTTEIAN